MAYNPGKDRNMMAALKRTMDAGWFGADVSQRSQAPNILSGEYLTSVNNAKTGIVGLVGSDVNDQVVFPLVASIPLAAADILALNTTPKQIVPAPPAGFAVIVDQVVLELNLVAPAFAGGGAVSVIYAGTPGTNLMAQNIPNSVINGAAGQTILALVPAQTAGGNTVRPATAVQLYAATANFTTGTGTGKVFVSYSLLTV